MRESGTGALALTVLAVLAGGCGNSPAGGSTEAGAAATAFPVTVRDAGGVVTVKRRPERIVSLSPSATEALFAVGAGDQVAAVDDESDHPRGVPRTDLSSYQPNVEAIASYRPDLVVVPASVPPDVTKGLRGLGLTVLAEPAPERLEQAYDQIRELGRATGHGRAGMRVAARVRAQVEQLIASAPDGPALKVFHELDPDLFTASSGSFIGRIYARLGLLNVADRAARRARTEYPQLSSEAVVAANPDLIVLADGECCGQTPGKVVARAGWDAVSAVRRGAVVAIDDDIASRWGPRIPVLVEQVVRVMERAQAAAGTGG
jgi:iron complex transport system substrate-binding protein